MVTPALDIANAPVAELPGSDREAFYVRVLKLNLMGFETGGCVLGLDEYSARGKLRPLFRVKTSIQKVMYGERVITSQRPARGAHLKPGHVVTLVLQIPMCHNSYRGACLDPNASDYDCAGGSGNGPKYTGFVTVVGYDEFGLDADNDGDGCE